MLFLGVSEKRNLISRAYNKLYRDTHNLVNRHLSEQLDLYIETMERTNGKYYENSFALMKVYFGSMVRFLENINI